MTVPREAAVRRQVLAYLRSLGPSVCYRSNPGSPFATAGDPDLFVCVAGRLICVELKRPGGTPTPIQARRLAAWAAAGAVVVVATGRDEVRAAVEVLLSGRAVPGDADPALYPALGPDPRP